MKRILSRVLERRIHPHPRRRAVRSPQRMGAWRHAQHAPGRPLARGRVRRAPRHPPPALGPGDPLPPMWHWFTLLDHPSHAELGADGHPAHGAFLPPIRDRRRMFAGGRYRQHQPIPIGADLTCRSSLANVAVKRGRSGELAFVTVRHELTVAGGRLPPSLAGRSSCAPPSSRPGRGPGRSSAERTSRCGGSRTRWSTTGTVPSADRSRRR
jgi:N-terminal half of MaoC dehydratase